MTSPAAGRAGAQARPGDLLAALEVPRAWGEHAALVSAAGLLALAPRGDGSAVLVLPGFTADDASTLTLRATLRALGHTVVGWGLGRNLGPTQRVVAGMRDLVDRLADEHGGPVGLVGWSLGGIFARGLAARRPDLVRRVVTLGSPYQLRHPAQSRTNSAYDSYRAHHVPAATPAAQPLTVPATSIYSRTDGVVAWGTCVEQPTRLAENIEVVGSHIGLGHNLAAVYAVADRLALPAGSAERFVPPPLLRHLYPARD